jgi:flagella basal body P-ring formation protein FlgA
MINNIWVTLKGSRIRGASGECAGQSQFSRGGSLSRLEVPLWGILGIWLLLRAGESTATTDLHLNQPGHLTAVAQASSQLEGIKDSLQSIYGPGTEIEWKGGAIANGEKRDLSLASSRAQFLGESSPGVARVRIFSTSGADFQELQIPFSAWATVWQAQRRVRPGEPLKEEDFVIRRVDLTAGNARDFRGLWLSSQVSLKPYEAQQTLLEGQFVLSSAVKKIPDVRRGDSVRIHLIQEGMTLSTSGTAGESGYRDRPVRVMTSRSKREFTGTLKTDGVVEVRI